MSPASTSPTSAMTSAASWARLRARPPMIPTSTRAEPAAVDLTITPSTPLSVAAGSSTTVTTTEHSNGPGTATGVSVTLTAPAGWSVKPASPVTGGNLAQGGSATQSRTVTAPPGSSSPVTASLQAHASYTSAGQSQQVTTSQQAGPAPAPLPAPVITSSSPGTPAPGGTVTLTGQNFGATQGANSGRRPAPGRSPPTAGHSR